MLKNWHIAAILLMAIGYGGCGGTLDRIGIGSEDSEMSALIQEQDDVAQKVAQSPVQIDFDKLNSVQEKLAEERN